MKAVKFISADAPCTTEQADAPHPSDREVVVEIKAAALNRRDYWIKKGIYKGSEFPCIPGSDGSGIVTKVGKEVDEKWLNQPVIINPGINWGLNNDFHSNDFKILGLPDQGTFAQYVSVPVENIFPKPPEWTFEKAAALPLAGLTAYRALFTRGNLQTGEKVLITGAGGGVSSFLIKFAVAAGADVYVTSSSEKKIKKAVYLGAKKGVFYTEINWDEELKSEVGEFDLIVDSAAGDGFEKLLSLLRIGGRIVIYGGTAGKINDLIAAKIFWKQATILGSTMGSPEDFRKMLDFVTSQKIDPEIDKIFPMEDAELAFKHMENQEQFGKIVIKIADFPY
ncbi:MAG: zinc-binding dehydrogenase [Bacteroidales bacterium]